MHTCTCCYEINTKIQTKSTGEEASLKYSERDSSPESPSTSKANSIKELHKILYLMDWFGFSDEFYLEMSMLNPTLPE